MNSNKTTFNLPTPVEDSPLWSGVREDAQRKTVEAQVVTEESEFSEPSPWGEPIKPPAHERTVAAAPISPLTVEPAEAEEPVVGKRPKAKQKRVKGKTRQKSALSMPKLSAPSLPSLEIGVPAPIRQIAMPALSAAVVLVILDARLPGLLENGWLLYGMAGASGIFWWFSLGVFERAVSQRMRVKIGAFLSPLTSLAILLSVGITVLPYSALVLTVYCLLFSHLRKWEKWVFGAWVAVAIGLVVTLLV